MANVSTLEYALKTLETTPGLDTVYAEDAADQQKLGFLSGKGAKALSAKVVEWAEAFSRPFIVRMWDSTKQNPKGGRVDKKDAPIVLLLSGAANAAPVNGVPTVERIVEKGAPVDMEAMRKALKAELQSEIFGEKLKEQAAEIEALHDELDELAKQPMNAAAPAPAWYDTPEGIEKVMNAARPWLHDVASMFGLGLKKPTAKAPATNGTAPANAAPGALPLTADQIEALRVFRESDPDNFNAMLGKLMETFGPEAVKAAQAEQPAPNGEQ